MFLIYKKIVKYLVIFGLYYLFVFGYFVPTLRGNTNYDLFTFLVKNRRALYSLLLFVFGFLILAALRQQEHIFQKFVKEFL